MDDFVANFAVVVVCEEVIHVCWSLGSCIDSDELSGSHGWFSGFSQTLLCLLLIIFLVICPWLINHKYEYQEGGPDLKCFSIVNRSSRHRNSDNAIFNVACTDISRRRGAVA